MLLSISTGSPVPTCLQTPPTTSLTCIMLALRTLPLRVSMPSRSIGNWKPLLMRIPLGRSLRACWIKSFTTASAAWSSYRIGHLLFGGPLSFAYAVNSSRTTDRFTLTTRVNSGPHPNGLLSLPSWMGRGYRAPCREFSRFARSAGLVKTDPVPPLFDSFANQNVLFACHVVLVCPFSFPLVADCSCFVRFRPS